MATSLPQTYKASLSTGVYGFYFNDGDVRNQNEASFERTMMPSTYKASLSTGVYGFYYNSEDEKEQKRYKYFPSISSGIFGTWHYNAASPFEMIGIKPMQTTTKSKKKRNLLKTSYGYSRETENAQSYNFQIQGPRTETTKDGKRFNVKLLQQFELPAGKSIETNLNQKYFIILCILSLVIT